MPSVKAVRPYQTRQNTPNIKLEVATQVDAQPVIVKIGGSGQPKVITGTYSATATYYQDKAAVEAAFALSGSFF